MTCGRRLQDWNKAGFRQRLHELLLSELRAADLLDFSRAVDSSHIRVMRGGTATSPCPVDRGRAGSKHHLMVEAQRTSSRSRQSPPAATATTSPN